MVRDAAEASYRNRRELEGISEEMILLARLYAYGFRGQIIGAFHATAQALESREKSKKALPEIKRIIEELHALGALSLEAVPNDFRAVLSTFYRYDQGIARVLQNFRHAAQIDSSGELGEICHLFIEAVQRVAGSSGIVITRDDEIPEQASFIVPSLGITIVPLIYGDQHSWNMAFLSGQNLDVPFHLHREGVEIHLGLGALHADTCLGKNRADVTEGYAMPIPAGIRHGFINQARYEHRLPFIFGSRRLGGWGIVPDVHPSPIAREELVSVDVQGKEMNGTVFLDREIEAMAKPGGNARRILISPEKTFSPHSGGLSLSVARVADSAMVYESDRFQIVSVVRGQGTVTIGPAKAELSPHAHFGIPAGVRATIRASDQHPLVLLDAALVENLDES